MPARRGGRGRGARRGNGNPRRNTNHLDSMESGDSLFLDDHRQPCSHCHEENRTMLSAACGHYFCRTCVENVVLPSSCCPFDQRYLRESRLSEFLLVNSDNEDFSDGGTHNNAVRALRERVNRLTVVMDRLIEHLAIRNMVNEHRWSSTGTQNGFKKTVEVHQLPTITDSDDPDRPISEGNVKIEQAQVKAVTEACSRLDVSMLCDLPSETLETDGAIDSNSLIITPTNVRQLLPRFWATAIKNQWPDVEKVQRLRDICSPSLKRLLDTADAARRDWAYISSILYGDHVMDEVTMIRCLGMIRQRFTETPHQWYLRVCSMVERGLPPGPIQDWEVRSAFIRGLHNKYRDALEGGNDTSFTAILARCSEVDARSSDPTANREPPRRREPICYSCGERGHVVRDCTRHNPIVDGDRWTPFN